MFSLRDLSSVRLYLEVLGAKRIIGSFYFNYPQTREVGKTDHMDCNEALSILMLCAPNNRRRPFSYHMKMADFEHFRVLSVF